MPQVNELDDDLDLTRRPLHESEDDDIQDAGLSDEDRARAERMGWVDRDKYRGDPDNWIDAAEFLRRGEERMPIMRERMRKQDQEIASLREELRDVVRGQREFERHTREQVEREFNERKRAAVAEADTEAFDEVDKQHREWLEKNPPRAAEAKPTENADPHFAPWAEKNPWYGTNDRMTKFANQMGAYVKETMPEVLGTPKFYDEVETLTRQQFPDHFENPNRSRAGAVEGARGGTGNRSGRGKSYADLPQGAKAKCDEYVAKGWTTKEEYVKDYFDEGNAS